MVLLAGRHPDGVSPVSAGQCHGRSDLTISRPSELLKLFQVGNQVVCRESGQEFACGRRVQILNRSDQLVLGHGLAL